MVSKKDIKILSQILDIDEVKVISHSIYNEIGIILRTEPIKLYGVCQSCGTESHKRMF